MKEFLEPATAGRIIKFLSRLGLAALALAIIFLILGYSLPKLYPDASPDQAILRFFRGAESALTYIAIAVLAATAIAVTVFYIFTTKGRRP